MKVKQIEFIHDEAGESAKMFEHCLQKLLIHYLMKQENPRLSVIGGLLHKQFKEEYYACNDRHNGN